jgi:hypothetical protein
MCEACRYPRALKTGDIVQCPGYKAEILKANPDRYDGDGKRQWYRVRILAAAENRIMDLPCNTLCYVSPEGDKLIYSEPVGCDSCGRTVRLSYPEDMGMDGYWTCPECGRQYPFAFYDIKCDSDYDGTGISDAKKLCPASNFDD